MEVEVELIIWRLECHFLFTAVLDMLGLANRNGPKGRYKEAPRSSVHAVSLSPFQPSFNPKLNQYQRTLCLSSVCLSLSY